MTRDEIIRMAREAGLEQTVSIAPDGLSKIVACPPLEPLERFAALVAAAEREACALLCDDVADNVGPIEYDMGAWLAAAIRARGNQ